MRLLLTGGGTGGHIYPALAVACQFLPSEVVGFVGVQTGLESQIVPRNDLPFWSVASGGVAGKSPFNKARGIAKAAVGLAQAARLLRRLRPSVVLATGGYACGPVALAAALAGVPVVLLEENAAPGITNRLLARIATRIAVPWQAVTTSFPLAIRHKVVVTGVPVRPEVAAVDRLAARRQLEVGEGEPCVLVFGGSQGAPALNRVALAIAHAPWRPAHLVWVCGRRHAEEAVRALHGPTPGVRLVPYAYDLPLYLAASDVVVARAGAASLAELTARGVASVLIPSAYVAGDHQTRNAQVLEAAGAAVSVPESELSRAVEEVKALLGDPHRRVAMAEAAAALGRPEAASAVADLVRGVARQNNLNRSARGVTRPGRQP